MPISSLSPAELLALFDQDQRYAIEYPGLRREELPRLVRHVDLSGRRGDVLFTRLDENTVEDVILGQVAYFAALGQAFEWKVYSHDRPPDLKDRLARHGFEIDQPEAVLVRDLAVEPAIVAPDVDVRRIDDHVGLADVKAIHEGVSDGDYSWYVKWLARDLRENPETISVYVAYVDGVPASTARISFSAGSLFAGLWGGSTLPAYRNRGLYLALLAAREREARERGVRFLTVDAGEMSRPILQKRGFQLLTWATACVWAPSSTDGIR